MRFFCSFLGFLGSPSDEGDCFRIFRNPRPDKVDGVLLAERSVVLSVAPDGGASSGDVSFRGVCNSRVTVDEASLPTTPANGVVASLEDADVTSIGAKGAKVDAAGAMEVFCSGAWAGASIAAPAAVRGDCVPESDTLSRENLGEWVALPPVRRDGRVLLLCTPEPFGVVEPGVNGVGP